MKFVPAGTDKVLFCTWDVRVEDFQAYAQATGYRQSGGIEVTKMKTQEDGSSYLKWELDPNASWEHPGFEQGPTEPVVGVSWNEAMAFCQWLTKEEQGEGRLGGNQMYRLPTDAEWSTAVGDGKYPWGEMWPPPENAGNYGDQALASSLGATGEYFFPENDGYARTSPVGSFRANSYGLYDMGGNVWQWCMDWYQPSMNSDEVRQKIPTLNDDGGGNDYKVLRGASWFDFAAPEYLLSSFRFGVNTDGRFSSDGFRLVVVVSPIADDSQETVFEPIDAEDYATRGRIRQTKGDLDGALADFNQAVALDPKNAARYYSRGNVKQAQGDLTGALADYDQGIDLDPKDPDGYDIRGNAREDKGDVDGALADFTRAIEFDPNDGYAYNGLGYAKQIKGDLDGAIADFNRALQLDPKDADACDNRGYAKQIKGDLDGAIADFNQAIDLDPKNTNSYDNRGCAKQDKGDLDGAIADFTRAVDLDPNDAFSYKECGRAQFIKRNWPQALADYQSDAKLDPKDAYPHFFMWLIRTRQGEKEAANQELAAYMENSWNGTPEDWVSKVASFLLDKISQEDFFAAAASPDAKKESGQRCEAWFYAGMKCLLNGDKITAAADFNKSLATNEKTFSEYLFAQAELKALSQSPSKSSE